MKDIIFKSSFIFVIAFLVFNGYVVYKNVFKKDEIKNIKKNFDKEFAMHFFKKKYNILEKMTSNLNELVSISKKHNVSLVKILQKSLKQNSDYLNYLNLFTYCGYSSKLALDLKYAKGEEELKKHIKAFETLKVLYENVSDLKPEDMENNYIIAISSNYSFIANLLKSIGSMSLNSKGEEDFIKECNRLDLYNVFDY